MTARIKKPVKVCYITSSFPNTAKFDGIKNKKGKKEDDLIFKLNKSVTKPYVNSFLYGSFRAMQQLAYLSRHNEFCKTLGVSPSKISDENLSEYAKTIAKLLDKDIESPQWGKIYDLSSNCWFDFELD